MTRLQRYAALSALALLVWALPAQATLVAYYNFEEGTGSTVNDISGGGHTGSLANPGGTDWVAGHVGSWALDLSSNQVVTTLNSAANQLGMDGNNPKTIALWSDVRSFNDGGLFDLGLQGSDAQEYCFRTINGSVNSFRAQYWGGNDFDTTLAGAQNNWHHYVLLSDGIRHQLFYDGRWVGYKTGTLSTNNGRNLEIGRYAGGSYLDGIVDEMGVYNNAIAPNQITYLAGGGSPATLPAAEPGLAPFLRVGPDGSTSGLWGIREVRSNGTISSILNAVNSLQSGTGTIFDGYSRTVNYNDPQSPGGGGYFGNAGKAPFLSNTGGDDDDISFIARSKVIIPADGTYTFGFRGDDGSLLKIGGANFAYRFGNSGGFVDGDTLAFLDPTGDSNSGAATFLTAGVHEIEFLFFERGGGAFVELWGASGDYSNFDPAAFHLVGDVANGGLQLAPEPATLTLLALGGLGLLRRRQRKV